MTTIVLVRHGENEWVKQHRLAGWLPDVHLNANGRLQAQSTAERLSHLDIAAIYSSPVERCMETAVTIADSHQLPIQQVEAIGEVRYGKWEGEKIEQLAKKPSWKTVQYYPSRMEFPEGETLRAVQFRAIEALEKLSEKHVDETIIVVSHADVIKLVVAHYVGTHIDLFQRIIISPASISVISLSADGGMRVVRVNDNGKIEKDRGQR